MIGTFHRPADKCIDFFISLYLLAGLDFFAAVLVKGRLVDDFTGQPDAGTEAFYVILMLQIVELYCRSL